MNARRLSLKVPNLATQGSDEPLSPSFKMLNDLAIMDLSKCLVPFIIVMSIISSVLLILVNKILMKDYGFTYVWTLTACHFTVTYLGLSFFACLNGFTPKNIPSQQEVWTISLMGVFSIVFNNFSLKNNSVGLYQIFKLCCIPALVLLQSTYYNVKFSERVKLSLMVLLLGVGITTVTDLSLNWIGFLWGCLAVASTTQYQTWQGSKQKEHTLNGIQLTHLASFYQAIISWIIAIITEALPSEGLQTHSLTTQEAILIGFTCLLAIAVNLCSFGLIGKTSAVTYQVVGHAKTCLVIIGGFLWVPSGVVASHSDFFKNIAGISIAMIGVIAYSHYNMKDKEEANEDKKKKEALDKTQEEEKMRLLFSNNVEEEQEK